MNVAEEGGMLAGETGGQPVAHEALQAFVLPRARCMTGSRRFCALVVRRLVERDGTFREGLRDVTEAAQKRHFHHGCSLAFGANPVMLARWHLSTEPAETLANPKLGGRGLDARIADAARAVGREIVGARGDAHK